MYLIIARDLTCIVSDFVIVDSSSIISFVSKILLKSPIIDMDSLNKLKEKGGVLDSFNAYVDCQDEYTYSMKDVTIIRL